eukprot:730737-Rhodomonas_salina.3
MENHNHQVLMKSTDYITDEVEGKIRASQHQSTGKKMSFSLREISVRAGNPLDSIMVLLVLLALEVVRYCTDRIRAALLKKQLMGTFSCSNAH